MKPFTSTLGATIMINVKLLFACSFGWTSWLIWSHAVEWWGTGVLSILFGFAGISLIVDAVRIMLRVYGREKTVREYLAQGGAPKSSETASQDHLDRAGMR